MSSTTDNKNSSSGDGEAMFSINLPYSPSANDLEGRKISTSDVEVRKLSSISIPSIPSVGSGVSNGHSHSFDLTGKIIVKAQLGDDIRRMPIHNEEITYDELLLMMQRIFKGSLKSDDDVLVKYKDEDGDLVTISDTSDLTMAIQSSRVLNLKLILKEKKEDVRNKKVADVPIRLIRTELKELRDRVNKILDYLDQSELEAVLPHEGKRPSVSKAAQTLEKDQRQAATVNINGFGSPEEEDKPISMAAVAEVPAKEFEVGFSQIQAGQGMDSSFPTMAVNGGATPKSAQLLEQQQRPPQQQQVIKAFQSNAAQSQTQIPSSMSTSTPSKQIGNEQHQQVPPQPHASSLFGNSGVTQTKAGMMEHQHVLQGGPTPSQPPPPSPQANRYPTSVPTSQSMPSMMGAGVGGNHSMINQHQATAQPQPGAYGNTSTYQQYGSPYAASSAPTPAQPYGTTSPAVQYPSAPQPRPSIGTSYPAVGTDTGPNSAYPQMPPTSSTMPMINAQNPSANVPNAAPSMPQVYAPPPQQYNSGMPPAMPSYRPQGPPPPTGGMGLSNPYSRSAVPSPQAQTYRPQM